MIDKGKFNELIETFMDCAALFEKSMALMDVIDSPTLYGIEEQQAKDMKDIISFHEQRYNIAVNELEESLADILSKGKDIQREYLGFEAEDYNHCEEFGNVKMTVEILDVSFKKLFAFSKPAHECEPKDRIKVFLDVLKTELKL